MFGGKSESAYWFDAAPLEGGRSTGASSRLRLSTGGGSIAAFAQANDLDHDAGLKGDLPSLLIGPRSVCKDVVATRGEPRVEIGNHGWKLWKSSDDGVPSRQGYVAVRHGRALPHVLVSYAGQMGAATALNLASAAVNFAGQFNFEDVHDGDRSPFQSFRSAGVEVPLGPDAGLTAFCEHGAEGQAQELLSGRVVTELSQLASSFTVEVTDSWVFAYSHFGDLSTKDAEIWAWAFSVASRLLDLAALWQETWPAAAGEYVPAGLDPRAVPFYTDQRVDRPDKLDGTFSFLKRSK